MKLIVGLGNPGPRYADSRHNVGFRVVDELGRRWAADLTRYDRDFEALFGQTTVDRQTILLLKPATYMNLSGRSVAAVRRYYRLSASHVLLIHDDLDLPVVQLRIRAAGSAGGHKGMEDVIRHLGTDELPRVRIGIGKVQRDATVEYVLSRFDPAERPLIDAAQQRAADAVECWLREGTATAMNRFNRRRDEPSREGTPPADAPSEGESS